MIFLPIYLSWPHPTPHHSATGRKWHRSALQVCPENYWEKNLLEMCCSLKKLLSGAFQHKMKSSVSFGPSDCMQIWKAGWGRNGHPWNKYECAFSGHFPLLLNIQVICSKKKLTSTRQFAQVAAQDKWRGERAEMKLQSTHFDFLEILSWPLLPWVRLMVCAAT